LIGRKPYPDPKIRASQLLNGSASQMLQFKLKKKENPSPKPYQKNENTYPNPNFRRFTVLGSYMFTGQSVYRTKSIPVK
jgi:hypothetical protein